MKTFVNRLLRPTGFRIAQANTRRTLGDAAEFLAKRGLTPAFIIDIGVAWGTQELYDAFPNAKLLLIEPNKDWNATLNELIATRGGKAYIGAAGAAEGEVTLNVWEQSPGCSTIHPSIENPDVFTRHDTVKVRTLDSIVADSGLTGPAILKIDVQGAELDVLRGATATLKTCQAVIVETSAFGGGTGPEIADIITHLSAAGFAVWDFVGFNYRPLDQALGQVDIVFVPQTSPLRKNHKWG